MSDCGEAVAGRTDAPKATAAAAADDAEDEQPGPETAPSERDPERAAERSAAGPPAGARGRTLGDADARGEAGAREDARADGPDAGARTVPVQRIRPGDHAFAAYAGEAEQREVLGAFIRQGLIGGEKVLVLLASGLLSELPVPELLSRLDIRTPAVEEACRRGRLSFGSMRELISPDREFTTERQWQRLREETARAVRQGYPAVRAYIDMAWVAELGADIEAVLHRERQSAHLFADRQYSEICAYDERAFPAGMAETHPRNVLGRLGSLRVTHSAHTVRVIGEADVTTSAAFGDAVRTAIARTTGAARRSGVRGSLTVDLTPLYFLGVGCAADLLRLCAGADGDRVGVAVRCSPFQARTLVRLGADAIPALRLDPTAPDGHRRGAADGDGAEGNGC